MKAETKRVVRAALKAGIRAGVQVLAQGVLAELDREPATQPARVGAPELRGN